MAHSSPGGDFITALTYFQIRTLFSQASVMLGLPRGEHGVHYLRIEAAMAAAALGTPDEIIRIGWWRSEDFILYIWKF